MFHHTTSNIKNIQISDLASMLLAFKLVSVNAFLGFLQFVFAWVLINFDFNAWEWECVRMGKM